MANTKISALGSGSTPQAADEFVIARAGANYKLTYASLFANVPSITIDDANFGLDIVSLNPRMTFDSGDYLEWNRAGNYLTLPGKVGLGIAPTDALLEVADGTNAAGSYVVGNACARFGSTLATNGSELRLFADSTNSLFALQAAKTNVSNDKLVLQPNGGDVGIGAAPTWGKLHVAGNIGASNFYVGGQATADSGTFGFGNTNGPRMIAWGTTSVGGGLLELKNPSGNTLIALTTTGFVQFIGDTAFSVSKSGGNPVLTLDTADYLAYDRATNSLNLTIGGSVMFQLSGGALVQYNAGVPSYWMVNSSLGANLKIGRIVLSTQDFVFSKFNDDFVTNTTLATITSGGQVRGNNGTPFGTTTTATNGAAAATGTLTNAPAAGNPTKWMPFYDNGTTRYIPMW